MTICNVNPKVSPWTPRACPASDSGDVKGTHASTTVCIHICPLHDGIFTLLQKTRMKLAESVGKSFHLPLVRVHQPSLRRIICKSAPQNHPFQWLSPFVWSAPQPHGYPLLKLLRLLATIASLSKPHLVPCREPSPPQPSEQIQNAMPNDDSNASWNDEI